MPSPQSSADVQRGVCHRLNAQNLNSSRRPLRGTKSLNGKQKLRGHPTIRTRHMHDFYSLLVRHGSDVRPDPPSRHDAAWRSVATENYILKRSTGSFAASIPGMRNIYMTYLRESFCAWEKISRYKPRRKLKHCRLFTLSPRSDEGIDLSI